MKNEMSNQIIARLNNLGLINTGKENIDQGERIVSILAGSWLLWKVP